MRAHVGVHSDFKVHWSTIRTRMIKRQKKDERDIKKRKNLYMEMEVSCIPNYCRYRGISHSAVYKCSRDGREKLHLIPISRLDLKPVLKRGEFCQKELCCFFSSCHYFLNTSRDIVSNNKLIPAKVFLINQNRK